MDNLLQSGNFVQYLPALDTDHIRGNPDAPLTLIEFGDYQCPACGSAYHVIRKLETELGSRLRFIFRHYAYAKLHPQAEQAAQVAEAAGAQEKFWEMHDLLFLDQARLGWKDLMKRAATLKLDLSRFEEDVKSEKYLSIVRSDFRTGVQSGVFATPGLFINGIRHNGTAEFEPLLAALQNAEAAAA